MIFHVVAVFSFLLLPRILTCLNVILFVKDMLDSKKQGWATMRFGINGNDLLNGVA